MKTTSPLSGKPFFAVAGTVLRSPRWQRRLAWAVGVWWLVWALAYAAVPLILKSQLETRGSEKLGRPLTVGAIDFKPWSLELTIHDLAIAKSGPSASPPSAPSGDASRPAPPPAAQAVSLLKIKRIYIDAALQSLLRLAPVVDAIRVEEPRVSLAYLGDGRYDLDDVVARLRTPAAEPASSPLQFAFYNLELSGGEMDFEDQSTHTTHTLRELHLAVPFLSNLPSQRDIKTTPHLAFRLNGSPFDTAAEGTPFAQTRKSDARITLRDLDLTPYLAYWPAGLPWRLKSGVLSADAQVAFAQTPATVVKISGTVTADKIRLLQATAPGAEVLAFDRLLVRLDDVRPLEQRVKLSAVELTAPTLSVTRNRAGQINLLPPVPQNAPENIAASARPSSAQGQKYLKSEEKAPRSPASAAATVPTAKAASAAPWRVQVDTVVVQGGRIHWLDETLPSPAQIRLRDVALTASALRLPFTASAPLQFKGALALDPSAGTPPARVDFTGSATDQAARLSATVAAWPLDMAAKYVGQFLLPALNGQLDAEMAVNWAVAVADQPQTLRITAPQLALSEVQLAQGKTSLVSVKQVALSGVDIDIPGQSFQAARMQLVAPRATVARGADQRWMYERWLVRQASASPPATRSKAKTEPRAPTWAVAISDVQLDGGAVSFSDKAGAKPVAFEITAAKARLGGLVLDERLAAKAQAAQLMPLTASLRLATGRWAPGQLDFKGSLGLAPLQAKGQIDARRLPVQAFEPYLGGALNIELLRADASFKGRVAYRQTAAGPQAEVAGDASLDSFKANTLAPREELLAWKALNVRGLSVALEPAQATRVVVKETVLSDFFARVIVTPEGRINLQDVLKPPAASATPVAEALSTPEDAPENRAFNARPESASGTKDLKISVQMPAQAAPTSPPPIVDFGPISLINGQVRFSDRFVRPNYSADLSALTGKLSAFSSRPAGAAPDAPPVMADLELRGKAEGTASLEILGKLNPLAKPLALDITGKVRDLELPPLSPYSVRYSGYGIERGKLSVDVNYVVQPDGQLTASNKLVLNQLSFGDKVAGSTASLPVKLAVALLADRNGVIDLDLPISGSLNDPQFRLGPVIVKVILNVIVKAITAPFSLLAHALGGGGDELSLVGFPAGSARLSPQAKAGLDKVAKALVERPALRLTVVGSSSLAAEREGFKRERLDELVSAEKRRQQGKSVKAGVQTEAGGQDELGVVTPADYPALLKAVYKRADIPKPRNLIGLTQDPPVAEMEKLLLADIPVSDDAMHALAVQRGVAVRDYLASRDLPGDRLFLGAVKAMPPDGKWTPRAELNLAMP